MKHIITTLFITLALINTLTHAQSPDNGDQGWNIPENPFHSDQKYGGLSQLKPSLKVRMAQGVSTMFRDNLANYGRSYLNYGYKMKDHGGWGINAWPFVLNFQYINLQHAPIQIDMSNFTFNYTHMRNDQTPVVFMQLPLIKDWSYMLDYKMQMGLIPLQGSMVIDLSEAYAIATVQMHATSDGILYPQLHDLYVDLGTTYLQTNGPVRSFFFKQTFNLFKYVMMDAANRFGKTLYNQVLPNYVKNVTNSQRHTFDMSIPQLEKNGTFNLDYRLTSDPKIHNNVMDLDFFFDIGPEFTHCNMKHEDFEYPYENYDSNYLQFVLSDRVPNCILDAMQRQDWFDYKINSDWMAQKLGTRRYPINAQQFQSAFPVIADMYGPDAELDLEIKMVNPRVIFGPTTGENVHFGTEIRFGIKEKGSPNYIIYDSMKLESTFDMEISEEILFANIQTMTVKRAGEPLVRSKPIYSDIDMSEQAYSEFWDYMDSKSNSWFNFLNEEVFGKGVPLPYWKLSFLTKLSFHPRAMSAVVSLFYND